MKSRLFLVIAVFPFSVALALEPTISGKGEEMLSDDFSGAELGKGWRTQTGEWKAVDGVMRSKQIPADNHSAAARHLLPMQDGIYQMRFRLVDEGTSFHFGFDPAHGELKKRGHLFSVIVSKAKVTLMKHIDKDKPKEDPNEVLATAAHQFEAGKWHTLLVEKKGDDVVAQILPDGESTKPIVLKATHPTFHVKTPTLVFRCLGDGVEIDDLKAWKIAQ